MNGLIKRIWIVLVLIAMFSLPIPGLAQEGGRFAPSETELVFTGRVGDALQRSFNLVLQGEPATGLELSASDLTAPDTGKVGVSAADIGIDPATIEALEQTTSVVVTLNGTQTAGNFEGKLVVRMQGVEQAEIKLIANIGAAPAVKLSANSQNVVLGISSPGNSFLPARASENSAVLNSTIISLEQDAESATEIQNVSVLALKRADGVTLPEQAISVSNKMPLAVDGLSGVNLELIARGDNLLAGEYSGDLLVKVKDQSPAVVVPLTVKVKDGRGLAFLLLLAGILVGALVMFWNKRGQVLFTGIRRVERLQQELEAGRYLTEDKKETIDLLIKDAMALIKNNGTADQVDAVLTAAENARDQSVAEVKEWLSGEAASLKNKFDHHAKDYAVCRPLSERVSKIIEAVENGKYPSLNQARDDVKQVADRYEQFTILLERVNKKLDSITDAQEKTEFEQRVKAAESLEAIEQLLAESKEKPTVEFVEESSGITVKDFGGVVVELLSGKTWRSFALRIKWARLVVVGIAFLFTLLVGWVTMYEVKDTFGANIQDYITLFLWSSTSSLIGEQTLDLKAILTQVQTEG